MSNKNFFREYPSYPSSDYIASGLRTISEYIDVPQTLVNKWIKENKFTMFEASPFHSVIPRSEVIAAGKALREEASDIPDHLKELGKTSTDCSILPAYFERAQGKRFLRIWCLYCRKWHFHGVGDGDRVAHCIHPIVCYTSYSLQTVGEWSKKIQLSVPTRHIPKYEHYAPFGRILKQTQENIDNSPPNIINFKRTIE